MGGLRGLVPRTTAAALPDCQIESLTRSQLCSALFDINPTFLK